MVEHLNVRCFSSGLSATVVVSLASSEAELVKLSELRSATVSSASATKTWNKPYLLGRNNELYDTRHLSQQEIWVEEQYISGSVYRSGLSVTSSESGPDHASHVHFQEIRFSSIFVTTIPGLVHTSSTFTTRIFAEPFSSLMSELTLLRLPD